MKKKFLFNGKFLKEEQQQWRLKASQEIHYSVTMSQGIFLNLKSYLIEVLSKKLGPSRSCVIIFDNKIYNTYGPQIKTWFEDNQINYFTLSLSVSELGKGWQRVYKCLKFLDSVGISRADMPVIAIGGGVLLDIVGLAVSLYRRGVPYIRIPTTVVAIIDAGVGVKVGVNFLGKRNRLGGYYAPHTVLLDRSFLRTLSRRHIANGLAEALKIAIVRDFELFQLLEQHTDLILNNKMQDKTISPQVIQLAVQAMLAELESDPWEKNAERRVDFGHTFSPAIEMNALPRLLHGEAVAIDIALCTVLSANRGLIQYSEAQRILNLIRAIGLPVMDSGCTLKLCSESLFEVLKQRKGEQRIPLPTRIGEVYFVNDINSDEVNKSLHDLQREAG